VTTRTTARTVFFRRPFKLSAADDVQCAGSYMVEVEEERLDTSFPAYRRIATLIRLPGRPGSGEVSRVVYIDPAELDAALTIDTTLPVRAEHLNTGRGLRMTSSKDPSWTWAFEEGILTVDHMGTTVSLGRYATREFAARAAASYIEKHADWSASSPATAPRR
jgi:hypothetical protein